MNDFFDQIMFNLAPNIEFGYSGDPIETESQYNKIKWFVGVNEETGESIEGNPENKPTWAVVEAELTRLKAEYSNQDYSRKRKVEYDRLNQFEMMFDDQRDNTTTWVDAINTIKEKYPKPKKRKKKKVKTEDNPA